MPNSPKLEKKNEPRKKTIKKGRQPIVTKGTRRTPPKNPKSKFTRKRVPGGKKLMGKSKKKFDDIPDSVSTFSKITGNRSKHMKRGVKKEQGLTEKPTNIRMDGDDAIVEERELPGRMRPQRPVTDKPNNIRSPINPPARF